MNGARRPLVAALVALAALAAPPGSFGADSMLYRTDGREVTFTNVAEDGARPVPGIEADWNRATRPAAAARLPTTIYDPFIDRLAGEVGLSPELIKAVALVESGLDPHAVSPKGAQGLMQLMPATAADYGVRDSFDPLENLRAGSTHLRRQLDVFDGDLALALAAYNAGEGAVRRAGGIPPYPETIDYVRRVFERLGRAAPAADARPARRRVPPARPVRIEQRPDGTISLVN